MPEIIASDLLTALVIRYEHVGARVIWRNRKAAGHRIRLAAAQLMFLIGSNLTCDL
jgi:hypothetical protein